MPKKIDNAVLEVLTRCNTNGSILFLPEHLDRKLYVEVDKVIKAAGGKWSRGAKGHVFDSDAGDAMEAVILTGEVTNKKQEFGQFDTPAYIAGLAANRLLQLLGGSMKGKKILEPSAGNGALAFMAAEMGAVVDCIEIDEKRFQKIVSDDRLQIVGKGDFLQQTPTMKYDGVLMNPPFAKRADIHHVLHALKFLKLSNARGAEHHLVAVMSAGVTFRSDKLTDDFRNMVTERGGSIEMLPVDSFVSSGTAVNTCLVAI